MKLNMKEAAFKSKPRAWHAVTFVIGIGVLILLLIVLQRLITLKIDFLAGIVSLVFMCSIVIACFLISLPGITGRVIIAERGISIKTLLGFKEKFMPWKSIKSIEEHFLPMRYGAILRTLKIISLKRRVVSHQINNFDFGKNYEKIIKSIENIGKLKVKRVIKKEVKYEKKFYIFYTILAIFLAVFLIFVLKIKNVVALLAIAFFVGIVIWVIYRKGDVVRNIRRLINFLKQGG